MKLALLDKWIAALETQRWQKCRGLLKCGERRCATGVLVEVCIEDGMDITLDGGNDCYIFEKEGMFGTLRNRFRAAVDLLFPYHRVMELNDEDHCEDFGNVVAFLKAERSKYVPNPNLKAGA